MTELSHATPARPLSPTEIEDLQTLAYQVEAKAVKACTAIQTNLIDLAETLYVTKEMRLWQVLDRGSYKAWLAGLPKKLSESHAFKLTRVYREFCVDRGIAKEDLYNADLENLQIALPAVKAGRADAAQVAADAKELTRGDMIAKFREGDPDAPLDAEAEPVKASCPRCGSVVSADRLKGAA